MGHEWSGTEWVVMGVVMLLSWTLAVAVIGWIVFAAARDARTPTPELDDLSILDERSAGR